MNSENVVIAVRDLRKRLGDIDAVAGLDFSVPQGSICGFLGRNGAGKTTTIKMLLGIMHPDHGDGSIFGEPIDDEAANACIRRRVGFVADVKEFYPFMTVRQMIEFSRAFYPR